jgi:hypothetical protein
LILQTVLNVTFRILLNVFNFLLPDAISYGKWHGIWQFLEIPATQERSHTDMIPLNTASMPTGHQSALGWALVANYQASNNMQAPSATYLLILCLLGKGIYECRLKLIHSLFIIISIHCILLNVCHYQRILVDIVYYHTFLHCRQLTYACRR